MNALGPAPWKLSFSYGRALQAPSLDAWKGQVANLAAGQQAFFRRLNMNSAACAGNYIPQMEKAA